MKYEIIFYLKSEFLIKYLNKMKFPKNDNEVPAQKNLSAPDFKWY